MKRRPRKRTAGIAEDRLEEMSNLSPATSGTGFIIHVYQDYRHEARHGPQIRVFPGHPSAGGGVSISIPGRQGITPTVICGDTSQFSAVELDKVFAFVAGNREALLRYWRDDLYFDSELLHDLKPVD